jgi:hypothetical protein
MSELRYQTCLESSEMYQKNKRKITMIITINEN